MYLLIEPPITWWIHFIKLGKNCSDSLVCKEVHEVLKGATIIIFIREAKLEKSTQAHN
jgi:hypothetical protein